VEVRGFEPLTSSVRGKISSSVLPGLIPKSSIVTGIFATHQCSPLRIISHPRADQTRTKICGPNRCAGPIHNQTAWSPLSQRARPTLELDAYSAWATEIDGLSGSPRILDHAYCRFGAVGQQWSRAIGRGLCARSMLVS